ncbi:MAG: prepilin-type N-terminal cleavage/methylation domain-containing protein [Synergistaceae bacterium]|nr:prepilin-type N-terminal cleavage/methylation domain-containing protein [Synergistaceae bacterium]
MKKRVDMKFNRGFSLTEVLIASFVMAVVGVAVMGSLWIFSGLVTQTEEYSIAQQEMETAFQTVGAQIGNAGLGMPNNKEGQGSFAESFYSAATPPVMASMGAVSRDWGGPVTLATAPDLKPASFVTAKTTLPDGQKVYAGSVLYYAWSLPTGVRVRAMEFAGTEIAQGDEVKLQFADGDVEVLESFQYDGREVGISEKNSSAASKASTRRWITFPTARVPFWLAGWDNGGAARGSGSGDRVNGAVAVMAPESRISFSRTLSPYEEVHLVQCCRLYLKNGELIQEFFDTGLEAADRVSKVVARGIAGLYFTFDSEKRLLTMYVAARGSTPRASGGSPSDWPEFAPPLSVSDRKYPIITGALSWRIRN